MYQLKTFSKIIVSVFSLIIVFSCSNNEKFTNHVLKNSVLLKEKPFFIPLNIGAVVPQGWLLDWSRAAAAGITGNLDDYSITFAEAWKGIGFKAKGTNEKDGTGWSLEQCSYWLDGAIRLAYIINDSTLIKKISKRLDLVVNGVLEGGETFIYWKDKSIVTEPQSYNNEDSGDFNSWAHSHMGRALIAYYQATQDRRILEALVKVYRDYPISTLPIDFEAVTGACNFDPMLETLILSGDTSILKNLNNYSKLEDYNKVAREWGKMNISPGHGVMFYENIRIPALVSLISGKTSDLDASKHSINWAESNFLLPNGLLSSEEYLAGIGSTRNVETCNISAGIWTFNWMLRITGQSEYADRIEKIFFNAAPAPISRDFKTMCYYQCSNRFNSSLPGEEPNAPGKGSYNFTPTGHRVLCCVGNNSRVIPNYIMHMWMATPDSGLASTLYGPCKVNSFAGNVPVEINCETTYPFEEKIKVTVTPSYDSEFPLYFRIPEWCKKPEIKINGNRYSFEPASNNFIRIFREWKHNDEIELHFPMEVKVTQGRETPYPNCGGYFANNREIAKDKTINNPYQYFSYGPLIFSLPIPDKNANKEIEGSKFNYALDVNPDNTSQIEIKRSLMPEIWQWQLDSPLKLRVNAKEISWYPTEDDILPKIPVSSNLKTKVELVPYGTTKFRVTMFPVTEENWILD